VPDCLLHVIREQVADAATDPFRPPAVAFGQRQQVQDPVEEARVEAVGGSAAKLPQPVKRVSASVTQQPSVYCLQEAISVVS
jgi:hypothetical protein